LTAKNHYNHNLRVTARAATCSHARWRYNRYYRDSDNAVPTSIQATCFSLFRLRRRLELKNARAVFL